MPEQRQRRPRPQPRPQPGNEPTAAIPAQSPQTQNDDPTTAIPTPRKRATPPEGRGDPESTEKINTRDDESKRRGGGLSAQDLLRREGRL
jgi:RND superfamily putative drug exporter